MMNDLARRFAENPILRPQDIRPSVAGMEVTCLLNPGVFRFEGKIWLLVRVAERPAQLPGKTFLMPAIRSLPTPADRLPEQLGGNGGREPVNDDLVHGYFHPRIS